MPLKTRFFVVTNWNLNSKDVFEKHNDQLSFLAYGEETCPSNGRPHHQSYLRFFNEHCTGKRALCSIAKLFKLKESDIHVKVMPMWGTLKQNEQYCSKESKLIKLGREPHPGERLDIVEICQQIQNGDTTPEAIAMDIPVKYHQYGRTFHKVHQICLRQKWRTWMTEGLWIYGPTGVGKSHEAFKDYHPSTHYIKNLNEDWWDGYVGQPIVILNEFRGQIKFSELLDLVDKWPKTVKIRHSEPVPFLAKKIIVTSCKHYRDVYVNCEESISQLDRRFALLHLTDRNGAEVLRG